MNPLTSPTYIQLIANYLPVSKRLICDQRLRNGKARKIVKDFSDLIGLALLNRTAHNALGSFKQSLVIPFPVSHLETLGYWKPTGLTFTKTQIYGDLIDMPSVTDLTLIDWWFVGCQRWYLSLFPNLTNLIIVDGLVATSYRSISIHTLHLIHCDQIDLYPLAQWPNLNILCLQNTTMFWSHSRTLNDWPSLQTVFLRDVESRDALLLDQFQPCYPVQSIRDGENVIGYKLGRVNRDNDDYSLTICHHE